MASMKRFGMRVMSLPWRKTLHDLALILVVLDILHRWAI